MEENRPERIRLEPSMRPEKGYRFLYPKEEERVRNAYAYALQNADVVERLAVWLTGNDLRVPDEIRRMVDKANFRLNSRTAERAEPSKDTE